MQIELCKDMFNHKDSEMRMMDKKMWEKLGKNCKKNKEITMITCIHTIMLHKVLKREYEKWLKKLEAIIKNIVKWGDNATINRNWNEFVHWEVDSL